MIQAKELRIGNAVYGFKTIWHIQSDDFRFEEMPYDAIPLTDEMLLKCGAKIIINQIWIKKEGTNELYLEKEHDKYLFRFDYDYSFTECSEIEIQYLHQLQNLYFALTQKELEMI